MSEIAEHVKEVAATMNKLLLDIHHTNPRIQLVPAVIPIGFDQRDIAQFCEEHGFVELRYRADTRQFFGARLMEDQPDYPDSQLPPMG